MGRPTLFRAIPRESFLLGVITQRNDWRKYENDVGADFPTLAEGESNPKPTTDGYDREAFKMGGGAIGGPNIYARVRPDSINIIEIAIRITYVGNPAAAWGCPPCIKSTK